MNTVVVKARKMPVSPQKVSLVCRVIRRKKASEALKILRFCGRRDIALSLTKLIKSGLDIAHRSERFDLDSLIIGQIYACGGQMLKRFQPRARGRAFRIRKRTSHVTLVLREGD